VCSHAVSSNTSPNTRACRDLHTRSRHALNRSEAAAPPHPHDRGEPDTNNQTVKPLGPIRRQNGTKVALEVKDDPGRVWSAIDVTAAFTFADGRQKHVSQKPDVR